MATTQTVSFGSIAVDFGTGRTGKVSLRTVPGTPQHMELVVENNANGQDYARAVGIQFDDQGVATIRVHDGPDFHRALVVNDAGETVYPAP